MTKERAVYVLENCHKINGTEFAGFKWACISESFGSKITCPNGITLDEDRFISMIWSLMAPDKSYYDAVVEIARGL